MDNELIKDKSFWQRHKIWIIGCCAIVLLTAGVLAFTGNNGLGGIARAYSDKPLYEEAIIKANKNTEVSAVIGNIKPIDKMAIAEGHVQYNQDAIASTITVIGTKGKAKMDIVAHMENGAWKYDSIKIRSKEPEQEIVVLGN